MNNDEVISREVIPPPPPPWILISTVVPFTAKVLPAPMKLSCVIPAPITVPPDWIPIAETKFVLTPVSPDPDPEKLVPVTTPTALIPPARISMPVLAVITPIESTFSYIFICQSTTNTYISSRSDIPYINIWRSF